MGVQDVYTKERIFYSRERCLTAVMITYTEIVRDKDIKSFFF